MAKLPVVSGEQAMRAFERDGWQRRKARRGSHVILTKPGRSRPLSIPLHRELDRGLLRNQIREAGLTVEEFCSLLG